jgi:hypothetical protein
MDSDALSIIVAGAVLAAILIVISFIHYRRRRVIKMARIMELLNRYYRGDLPLDQLGQRTREIASRHFMRSTELYSLVISAFQDTVDAMLARRAHSKEDERKLLSLLAAVKKEFGLTDRYRIEAWRSGRE